MAKVLVTTSINHSLLSRCPLRQEQNVLRYVGCLNTPYLISIMYHIHHLLTFLHIKSSKMPAKRYTKKDRIKGVQIFRPFGMHSLPYSENLVLITLLLQSTAPSPNPSTPPTAKMARTKITRTNGPSMSKASTTKTYPTGSKKSNSNSTRPIRTPPA